MIVQGEDSNNAVRHQVYPQDPSSCHFLHAILEPSGRK